MKKLAWMAGAVLATAATMASAQMYYGHDSYNDRPDWRNNADQECVNTHTGRFERVRPGEYQDDLDFRRCRVIGYSDARPAYREYRERREECWNPRQGHYELARRGENQGDLDYSRCRIVP